LVGATFFDEGDNYGEEVHATDFSQTTYDETDNTSDEVARKRNKDNCSSCHGRFMNHKTTKLN
jgi:hypothetical protein